MNLCKTIDTFIVEYYDQVHNLIIFKPILLKQLFNKQNPNFGSFSADFRFQAEPKKVTSRAELKIFQLELWLQPARLGLITRLFCQHNCSDLLKEGFFSGVLEGQKVNRVCKFDAEGQEFVMFQRFTFGLLNTLEKFKLHQKKIFKQ